MNSNLQLVHSYVGNQLVEPLGPILSNAEIGKHLTYLPPVPKGLDGIPNHIRMHQLISVLDLYIPSNDAITVASAMDLLILPGYAHRVPTSTETWRTLYQKPKPLIPPGPRQLAASLVGIGGSGKSIAVERGLQLKPQTVFHDSFPNMATPLRQLVWLKVDAPASGKTADLADALMRATDEALGSDFFEKEINAKHKNGLSMLHRWHQKVSAHFLGLLVLDEIQNLFKIQTIKKRRNEKLEDMDRYELRIKDDDVLKFIINVTNTNKRIPLLTMSTPDGNEALSKRFSTAQRLSIGGSYVMHHILSPEDTFYMKFFFPRLCQYQWVDNPLPASDELRVHLHTLAGGVMRIIVLLWVLTQRRVLTNKETVLTLNDFTVTMDTVLSPLKPAIAALRSNDPSKLRMYEDLLPKSSDRFWANINSVLFAFE